MPIILSIRITKHHFSNQLSFASESCRLPVRIDGKSVDVIKREFEYLKLTAKDREPTWINIHKLITGPIDTNKEIISIFNEQDRKNYYIGRLEIAKDVLIFGLVNMESPEIVFTSDVLSSDQDVIEKVELLTI